MRMRRFLVLLSVFGLSVGILATATAAEEESSGYNLTVLEDAGATGRATAEAVSNSGVVAGWSNVGPTTAARWQRGGSPDLAPFEDALSSRAFGVNSSGQIVGRADLVSGDQIAFLWKDTTITRLPSFGVVPGSGIEVAAAYDINESGLIVGTSTDQAQRRQAVVWIGGEIMQLDGLTPTSPSLAFGVNNHGQVVGTSRAGGEWRAVLWESGTARDLGSLIGVAGQAAALDINDRGQIVGASATGVANELHAVMWEPDGTIVDLGTLGGTNSTAEGINNRGQIVGSSQIPAGDPCTPTQECTRAFLWEDGTMVDLGAIPTWPAEAEALDINERGVIVGWSAGDAVMWVPSSDG